MNEKHKDNKQKSPIENLCSQSLDFCLPFSISRTSFALLFYLLGCIIFPSTNFAQTTLTTLTKQAYIKAAQAAEKTGNWFEAATLYENAWRTQTKNYDVFCKAAALYLKSRDYLKATQCYKILSVQPKFAPMRLDYARALQQNGQFDDAIPEYLLYLNNYEKKDRDAIAEKIEFDIAGCAKAIRETDSLSKRKDFEHWNSDTKLLSNVQGSPMNVQSPILFSDDILYYIAQSQKDSALMRTQWLTGDWSQGEKVPNFSEVTGGVIENGTFSTNGNVFYFSRQKDVGQKIKEKNRKSKEIFFSPVSQLYAVERVNDTWSSPILLNENINAPFSTNTQPFSIEKDGYEYLFFSSDRKFGSGGMDIWFSRRKLDQSIKTFEPAQNCGKIINTDGDEVTPFYDVQNGTLYFSSNSRIAFGGFDVFSSKGWSQQWMTPENIGLPFNSSADDIYFRMNKSHTLSLIISNRLFGTEKLTTRDDDLFSFILKNNEKDFFVNGFVFDKANGNTIKNERITLYEKKDKEDLRLLSSIVSNEGLFRFPIFPNKSYSLEIDKDSFNLKNLEFSTGILKDDISQPVFLDKTFYSPEIAGSTNRNKEEVQKEVLSKSSSLLSKTTKINSEKTKEVALHKNNILTKSQSANSNIVFKIQILAYEEMDWSIKKRLIRVEDIGNFVTEKININGKNFTRVLLKGYDSYAEASSVLRELKNRSLNDAFIVRYENGKRVGR